MIDQIQIVSWLLTRKCNLNCSYCKISTTCHDNNLPAEYPKLSHYHANEMSTEYVIETLRRFKAHNPDSFHILYGGEPFLRKDLLQIVEFCNKEEINYTIITNNSDALQPIIEDFFNKIDMVNGFTSSVDPVLVATNFKDNEDVDRHRKSVAGFQRLQKYAHKIKDPVAEITADNYCAHLLPQLVDVLAQNGIGSDITFVDIAKNPYYDFSNVTDKACLVQKGKGVKQWLDSIAENNSKHVHMADTLLPQIYNTLPANMDCGIEKNIHNMTVDADGTVRLCLRIRGVETPSVKVQDILAEDGTLDVDTLKPKLAQDKESYCEKCNWTCMLMSKIISEGEDDSANLIHSEIRSTNGETNVD